LALRPVRSTSSQRGSCGARHCPRDLRTVRPRPVAPRRCRDWAHPPDSLVQGRPTTHPSVTSRTSSPHIRPKRNHATGPAEAPRRYSSPVMTYVSRRGCCGSLVARDGRTGTCETRRSLTLQRRRGGREGRALENGRGSQPASSSRLARLGMAYWAWSGPAPRRGSGPRLRPYRRHAFVPSTAARKADPRAIIIAANSISGG